MTTPVPADGASSEASEPERESPDARVGHADSHPILVVEENAHNAVGHYAELFADLAIAVQDLGYSAAVLTARGWALENDPSFGPLQHFQFGAVASAVMQGADLLERLHPHRFWRLSSNIPRSAAIIGAARARRRRLRGVAVITMGRGIHPLVGALLAGREDWLIYRFDAPARWLEADTTPGAQLPSIRELTRRMVLAITRRVERSRERRGGAVRIVVNNEGVRQRWQRVVPFLSPVFIPFAMSKDEARIPDARRQLGFDTSAKLALAFGAPHGGKDLDTVWCAFARPSEWQLVVAGKGAADAYRDWARDNAIAGAEPILFDGYVDHRTRALLYSAADVTVLSFKPGTTHDSATLTDALTWGVPVVCSDGCPSADVVRRYGIGAIFEPGDASSLSQTVRTASCTIDPEALRGAREAFSARRTAARLLELTAIDRK
jgi:glycosyltransferase involved in cell wall biosynthesis